MPPKPKRNVAKEVEQLRTQLAQLNSRLAGSSSRRSGRSRSRSRSRSRGGGPRNSIPAAQASVQSSRGGMRQGGSFPGVTVRGHEMVRAVKVAANKSSVGDFVDINPGHTSLGAELSAMAKLFTQYRVVSLDMEYEPLCGTTTNGAIIICASPSSHTEPKPSFEEVSVCQPNKTGPLYSKMKVTVPKSFLVEKVWYDVDATTSVFAEAPCFLQWWVDCDSSTSERSLGRIWIRYVFEFQGFRKPA